MNKQEAKEAAMTIVQQLGGKQFVVMTGARNIVFDSTASTPNVSLKFMGSKIATHVKIELDVMDTYTVTFYKIRGAAIKTVKEWKGVYNDMLQGIFTETTGLDTRLY